MQDAEHVDSLLRSRFMTMDGVVGINNLLHSLADATSIIERHGMPDVQIYIVAIAHRDVDGNLTLGVEVVDSLTENKK